MTDTTVAIGVFDGVHRGHQALLRSARALADERGGRLVAVSFEPHPVLVLRPADFAGVLTLPPRRTDLLRTAGADHVEYLTFDERLRDMSPDEFAGAVLVEQLAADAVVVGANFTFGRAAAGTVALLETLGKKYGFTVVAADLVGDGKAWSSTRVRASLGHGEVSAAADILGRPHRLSGIVIHGDHRGRTLGYPTANMDVDPPLVMPADGVYSAIAWQDGDPHPAAISIGTNPTFDDVVSRRVEVHVIGRDDLDWYGHRIEADLLSWVRGMTAFDNVDQLVSAMASDVEQARQQVHRYAADFALDTRRW